MAYTDDWESIMNGVFGVGGKYKGRASSAAPADKPAAPRPRPSAEGLPDLNAALLEQQKQLDAMLRRQNEELKRQDTTAQAAL